MSYILCLHGYLQNGEIMAKSMGKLLPATFNIICPTAPISVAFDDKVGFGWCNVPDKLNLTAAPSQVDIDTCLAFGRNIIKTHGQPKYVVGFSQGASCATLWLQENIITPEKMILLSNFALKQYLTKVHKIPSMHIYGERDTLLSSNFPGLDFKVYSLYAFFEGAQIYTHKWGHVIPSDQPSKRVVSAFLSD